MTPSAESAIGAKKLQSFYNPDNNKGSDDFYTNGNFSP